MHDLIRRPWLVLLLAMTLLIQATALDASLPGVAGDAAQSPLPAITSPTGVNPISTLPTGANVAILKVEGMIYGYTLESLRDRVNQAVQGGASLIVIELDTPGGTVDSALKISKYIKSMTVPTVAWINPQAYSAGILIASACNQIVMSPVSATGDCAPIVPGMNLSPTERAKALSPILEEFRDSARSNDYDYSLFHAMCVLGVELYQVEHTQTGQRRLVNQADYAVMVQGKTAEEVEGTANPPAASQPAATAKDDVGAATVSVADTDRGQWKLTKKIHDGKTLLTLNQQRALDAGLASAIVRNDTELQQYLGAATIRTISPNTVALIAYWLTLPAIRALLMVVLFVGTYIELQAPGVGAGGMLALTALALLLVAPFLIGLAQVWHVLLFFVGLLLLLVEFFVIPGFGVAGIGGIVCMFVGLVLMIVPSTGQGLFPMPAPEMARRLQESVISALMGIIASGVAFYYITKHFGSLPVLNRLILKSTPPQFATGIATADRSTAHVSGDEAVGQGRIQPGAKGRAITELRPTGRAEIDGQIIDVITQGEWIEPDSPIQVLEVQGNRIVVETDSSKSG